MNAINQYRNLILTFLTILSNCLHGQHNWEIGLQIKSNFGSHVRYVGALIYGQYNYDDKWLVDSRVDIGRFWKDFGVDQDHSEVSIGFGVYHLWGERPVDYTVPELKYIQSVNRTHRLGYSWERFFNTIGTSQNIGTISYQYDDWMVHFSNDALANINGKDRYRTGAISIGKIMDRGYIFTSLRIWTGDTHCEGAKTYRDTEYPARWGYRDIGECDYGKKSHGIWSSGFNYTTAYGQSLGVELGIDDERIRNFVQNKVFHDLYWIPNFMQQTKNVHLPMKTKGGDNYLYFSGQEIKPGELYWQFSTNSTSMF